MTAKEKAKELVDNMLYCYQGNIDEYTAKQCALVSVDEIYKLNLKVGAYVDTDSDKENYYSYWEDVKKEVLTIDNKAREYSSPLIEELLNEISPEEMEQTQLEMQLIDFAYWILKHYNIKWLDTVVCYTNPMNVYTPTHKVVKHYLEENE
jgi:hypothetical protein